MMEAYNALEPAQKIFWMVAIIASIVFVIQTIMTFIGLDHDTDLDAGGLDGVDADGVSGFFTLKNLVNFLLGYGWAGICFKNVISSPAWLQAAAVGVGVAFVIIWVIIVRQVMKLGVDKTFHIEESVGAVADVYLRIPAPGGGKGKVQVSVRGSVHELDAVSANDEIPTGAKAKILRTIGTDTVEVEKV